jgi:hypothetical protein
MNAKSVYACVAVLLMACATGRADFKCTRSSKITGGALNSMMKVAGVFSKQAREPDVTTEYLKGHKMRTDNSDGQSTIIDLDGRQIIQIDSKKRTYSVMTFDQMRQAMEQAKARMQAQMAKAKENQQDPNLKITPKVSVTDGAGARTILGMPTHEVKMDIEMLMEASDPNKPGQSGQVQTWIKSDQYVAPSVPGADDFREFQQAMAKELDWFPGEMFGGNMQVSDGMAELRKNAGKLNGFPMLQYISLGMGAPGQPGAANANPASAQQPEQPQQSSGSVDITNPEAAAAQALGGMFGGFHRHKKEKEQASAGPASQSAAPPSEPGSLMEMTVEVTALSSDSLDSSLFAPPAGYQQVEFRGFGAADSSAQ